MPAMYEKTETLSTSDLCRRIGFNVSTAFIKNLGVRPAMETGNGIYWRMKDVPAICRAIAERMESVAKKHE